MTSLSARLYAPLLCGLLLAACSSEEAPPVEAPAEVVVELPEQIEISDPERPLTRLEFVEDVTEEVADRLLSFSDSLRRRDFTSAESFLAPSFAGMSFSGLAAAGVREEHLGAVTTDYDVETSEVVGRAGFLTSLKDWVGAWSRVESVIWKTKGAEFETGSNTWGKIKLYVHITGTDEDGGGISLASWGWARAIKHQGQWVLDRSQLTDLAVTRRPGTIFTDVSVAAGVAHTGIRFGKPGNTSYAFNGAASTDLNGDGLFDLFVPSDGRNFLYLSKSSGGFEEAAEARGVAQPEAGTGCAFFDFDNDGDQDLIVGQVGWRDASGAAAGQRIQLYVNDGEGTFEERGEALGLAAAPLVAYSLSVLDYDGDGFLDVFVCGYGRLEVEHNNSWIEATNGAPNGLLRNEGGERFTNVAPELGLEGSSWSYASAAADFDADGDVDLYVANDYGTNQLWRNEGGRFVDVAEELGVLDSGNGMGVSWGDLDSDGRLDLYVSNMSSTAGNRILGRLGDQLDAETLAMLKKLAAGNSIFLQGTDGRFLKQPKSAGGVGGNWAWSTALCDLDLDGALDVFCANGFVTGDQAFDT